MARAIPMARAGGTRSGAPYAWLKPGVTAGAMVPLAVMMARAARGTLGANPVAEALNQLGLLALVLLLASLACTPLKIAFGWTWPLRIRKTLGLLGFFYATLHLLTYAAIDQVGQLAAIVKDVVERPFITVGLSAWILLVPLAVTSTARMRMRLGNVRWTRLHRLAYLTAALGVVHFVWRVKKDVTEPLVYGAILALLLGMRLLGGFRAKLQLAARR